MAKQIFGWAKDFKYTAEDVKKRRQALAFTYHPDKIGQGGDDSMMQKINAAAEILLKAVRF